MNMFHRIRLIAFLVISIPAASFAANWNDQVGLQLESLKSGMTSDMPDTLAKVHDFGFKYVELVGDYNMPSDALLAELKAHQLTAVSAHFTYARFRDDPEGIASEAERLGLKFVGCPSLPQKEKLDLAGCEAAIKIFNRAGEILAKHGIKFFYHPHGYEFKPHGDGTLFDLLVTKTDPRYLFFQMDIFWIVHAGQNPAVLFERYGNRWISMHLKDVKKGAKTGVLNSHAPKSDFVPIGQGQIDFTAVIKSAHEVGIKCFFIEDESASTETSIQQSVSFLKKMKW
jgi:sugar phosphate isomerase/epimerase